MDEPYPGAHCKLAGITSTALTKGMLKKVDINRMTNGLVVELRRWSERKMLPKSKLCTWMYAMAPEESTLSKVRPATINYYARRLQIKKSESIRKRNDTWHKIEYRVFKYMKELDHGDDPDDDMSDFSDSDGEAPKPRFPGRSINGVVASDHHNMSKPAYSQPKIIKQNGTGPISMLNKRSSIRRRMRAQKNPEIDFLSMPLNTLRRFKKHYKIQTRPNLNKAQLAETVSRHFKQIPVVEKEVVAFFMYMAKSYKSKFDSKLASDSAAPS